MTTTGLSSYSFPYSYFSCPCTEASATDGGPQRAVQHASQEGEEEAEQTFDPRDPRSNYSLYPLEHLMWCEDCHDIRCPRCTTEEIVCWYCPSCLFEVASGMVKSEGNRCTRNCHNCPICTAPMSVNSLDMEAGGMAGPWILACDYCGWSTREIDIQFDKPNNIFGQLARIYSGKPAQKQASRATAVEPDDAPPEPPKDHDARFKAMRAFYAQQLSKASPADPLMSPTGAIDYNSPSSLARIMSLYTGAGNYGKKAAKPTPIRAAIAPEEGMQEYSAEDDLHAILHLSEARWDDTADAEQRGNQSQPVRFVRELRPVPVLLRTKRSRRCRTCRHILVRPEAKVSSVRYRIKLVASNHVPALTLTPLPAAATAASGSAGSSSLDLHALPPSRPLQFVLTVRNPMFDAIKVTLATPSSIPGHPGGRVTILCPDFDVGANTDMWDEALRSGSGGSGSETSRRGGAVAGGGGGGAAGGGAAAEAGKIWERGRNWTSVVLEVVGPRLLKDQPPQVVDEERLEIPVYFRIEYEADAVGEAGAVAGLDEDTDRAVEGRREKRELAYWCVLGVGKMDRVDA